MGMMVSLPFMPLPRARILALKRKPLAGWDESSMALALDDHVVSGTLVFVMPEVRGCQQGYRLDVEAAITILNACTDVHHPCVILVRVLSE